MWCGKVWLITHPHPVRQGRQASVCSTHCYPQAFPSPDGSPSQPATHRMANNGFLFLFIGSRRIGSRSEHSICRYIARPPSPNGPHDSIRPLVLRPSSSLTRWTEIVVHPQRKRTMNAGEEKREAGDNGFHGALHELGASSANS